MTRRPLVIAIALVGAVIFVVAGVFGVRSYLDAVQTATPSQPTPATISVATESAYRTTVASYPFALPPGDALPRTPPVSEVSDHDSVAPFVSFFFRCAWQHRYLTGKADDKNVALTNLEQWERLPPSTSGADNSDNAWNQDVMVPAVAGDDSALKGLYQADCIGDRYAAIVTTPALGLVIDQPQLTAVPTAALVNPCADSPVTAPCDPAFGPNRTIDLGVRSGARGTVTLDGAGVPRSYLVAGGDNASAIAARFGGANLWSLNCFRRSDLTLYAGDTLNLDVYTVATVGTENGSTVSKSAQTATMCLAQSSVPPGQVTP